MLSLEPTLKSLFLMSFLESGSRHQATKSHRGLSQGPRFELKKNLWHCRVKRPCKIKSVCVLTTQLLTEKNSRWDRIGLHNRWSVTRLDRENIDCYSYTSLLSKSIFCQETWIPLLATIQVVKTHTTSAKSMFTVRIQFTAFIEQMGFTCTIRFPSLF